MTYSEDVADDLIISILLANIIAILGQMIIRVDKIDERLDTVEGQLDIVELLVEKG